MSADGRSFIVRDASHILEGDEGGDLNMDLIGFVYSTDPASGFPTEVIQALPDPKNWHLAQTEVPLDPDHPKRKRKLAGIALVSDFQHTFKNWALTRGETFGRTEERAAGGVLGGIIGADLKSQFLDDWDALNRTTRISDCKPGGQGRTALLASLCRVVDSADGQYAAALPIGFGFSYGSGFTSSVTDLKTGFVGRSWMEGIYGDGSGVAAGYVYNGTYAALLDTVFIINGFGDVLTKGREGTPTCLLGLRQDAHWEVDSEHHGSLLFAIEEISGYKDPAGGIPYKATLAHDSAVANDYSGNKHETGKFRPWYRMANQQNEAARPDPADPDGDYILDGTPTWGGPGEGGTYEADGGWLLSLALSNYASPGTDNLRDQGTFGYLAITARGADPAVTLTRDLWVAMNDGGGGGAAGAVWRRAVVIPRTATSGQVPVCDGAGDVTWTTSSTGWPGYQVVLPIKVAGAFVAVFNSLYQGNTAGGPINAVLPAANTATRTANMIAFRSVAGGVGAYFLVPAGGDTIDGVAGPFNLAVGLSKVLIADGANNWVTVS